MPDSTRSGLLSRRRVLGLLSASAVGALSGRAVHPLVPVQEGEEWHARFFDGDQLALVAELAERIVPETDTPGARSALVHQYLDWRLSQADEESQTRFRSGLAWIERDSRARHEKAYLELSVEQRHGLLARLAEAAEARDAIPERGRAPEENAVAFFRELKSLTVEGYYRSEVGMAQELGYEGNRFLRRFDGCQHPEHLAWEPAGDSDEEG